MLNLGMDYHGLFSLEWLPLSTTESFYLVLKHPKPISHGGSIFQALGANIWSLFIFSLITLTLTAILIRRLFRTNFNGTPELSNIIVRLTAGVLEPYTNNW